jgi:hypothetical protein
MTAELEKRIAELEAELKRIKADRDFIEEAADRQCKTHIDYNIELKSKLASAERVIEAARKLARMSHPEDRYTSDIYGALEAHDKLVSEMEGK